MQKKSPISEIKKNVFSVCVWKTQFYSNQKIGKTLPRYVTLVAIKKTTHGIKNISFAVKNLAKAM